MTDTKTQLQAERTKVAEALRALDSFRDTDEGKALSARMGGLVTRQYHAQQDLLYVLDQRLALIDIEAEAAAAAEHALQAATPVE